MTDRLVIGTNLNRPGAGLPGVAGRLSGMIHALSGESVSVIVRENPMPTTRSASLKYFEELNVHELVLEAIRHQPAPGGDIAALIEATTSAVFALDQRLATSARLRKARQARDKASSGS